MALDSRELAKRVRWPGALLVTGGALHIVWTAVSHFLLASYFEELLEGLRALSPAGRAGGDALVGWNSVSIVLGIALSLVLVAGGVQMMRGRSWGLSLAAAVTAMVPCLAPCCGALIPVGIWAVYVLGDAEVRQAMSG